MPEEAERLAAQRRDDLAAISERELERARAQGRKEAEDDALAAETKKHFLDINGSIAGTAAALENLTDEVHKMAQAQKEKDLVNAALVASAASSAQVATDRGARKLTKLQTRLLVGAGVISGLTLLLGVIQEVVKLI